MATAIPIKHVVIIVKENHGYDNYFGPYPGGAGVTMPHSPNPPPKDPIHRHAAWLTRDTTAARVQFQQNDIPHYWRYASQFTLCDNYYTDAAGPSTPNHLMLIMADSPLIDNPSRSYRTKPGPPLYDKPSLPAQLDAAKLNWGNYNGYAFEFIKYTPANRRRGSSSRPTRLQETCHLFRGCMRTGLSVSTRPTRRRSAPQVQAT